MSIAESYKCSINNSFRNVVFMKRDEDVVLKTLCAKAHGSETITIIPPIQGFKLEKMDETHDRASFGFDDYSFVGTITWRPCADGVNVVFVKIE